jgi:hypothetical protein
MLVLSFGYCWSAEQHMRTISFALQVNTPGRYNVAAMYYSRSDAFEKGDGVKMEFTFKVSVGTFQQIKVGKAQSVTAVLPQTVSKN